MDPLSDWEQPISQDDLNAIEAAFDSASSLLKRKRSSTTVANADSSKACRRLPNWGTQQSHSTKYNLRSQSKVLNSEAESTSNSERGGISNVDSCPKNGNLGFLRRHQVTIKMRYQSVKFGGHIVYCRTFSEVEKATVELLKLFESKQKNMDQIALGFDIEWRPTFRRGEVPRKAAVMQICGDTSRCYVFHIIHSGIPPILQSLLNDPKYVKVGVCIAGDADKILRDYNIHVNSLEDLSWLANQKLDGFPRRWSLASLTEMITCKQLEKPNKIRLGNWEVNPLSKDQLQYAATDAFISWHLHQILKSFPDLPKNQNEEKVDPDLPKSQNEEKVDGS